MKSLPSISVVVPSFNQARFLAEALESVLGQGYPMLELLVLDGGSTDGSVDVIRRFESRLAFFRSEKDRGQADAINEGVRRAGGDLVAWLNSDDLYAPGALWAIGRAWAAHPGHGLYVGNGMRLREATGERVPFSRRHVAFNRRALERGVDYIQQPSVFFLRDAWRRAGGLDEELHFCLDWDLLIRIAREWPAVLVNEVLSFSREYADTKTSRGKTARAFEICEMVRRHTGADATPGTLYYVLETLLDVGAGVAAPPVRDHIYLAMGRLQDQLGAEFGNRDGFPDTSDSQDVTWLPFPAPDVPAPPIPPGLPRITVITPSFNQATFLPRTLNSILDQRYPHLETIVFDGGSTDGSVDVLERYGPRLSHWASENDRGPAHALNKGLVRATGDVVGWVNSDDVLADGALVEVGKAFAADPELGLVYGDALYIDEADRLFLADHGRWRTGLYFGEIQPRNLVPAYWKYVHSLPQPTVFFRRSLLEKTGLLDESFHFIFDFELFFRLAAVAKVGKVHRVQAFYRIHAAAKTSSWDRFLVELYRFSRPWWPARTTPEFRETVRDFVKAFLVRRVGASAPRDARWWALAGLVTASAVTGLGNPEAWFLRKKPWPAPQAAPASAPLPSGPSALPQADPAGLSGSHGTDPAESLPPSPGGPLPTGTPAPPRRRTGIPAFSSAFCSFLWPRHPGYSGGEIRDFYLLRHLLGLSRVDFFVPYPVTPDNRADLLLPFVDALEAPRSGGESDGGAGRVEPLSRSRLDLLVSALRYRRLPVVGPRWHYDAAEKVPPLSAHVAGPLADALATRRHDFLFVSPQANPIALLLDRIPDGTRLVMASYDVEAVRLQRLAASQQGLASLAGRLEAARAARFERENLTIFDGVIAVSALDRDRFVSMYGFPPERVVVIDNGVDLDYFTFRERPEPGPLEVLFVGSLGYLSNEQAAVRLVERIMPIVRRSRPDAVLRLVGQAPGRLLTDRHDGSLTLVTGRVDDVRPYLARATVGCYPLVSGAGTKYKILEALSSGLPVVTTSLGTEGLEVVSGEHLLVAEGDEEIAGAILSIGSDRTLSARLAREGRDRVALYSWEENLGRLGPWLAELRRMNLRRRGATAPAGRDPRA